MASESPNLIWNETYSSKYIPVQVCASPSIFVNLNPTINDPLSSMPLSIRNKNRRAAILAAQVNDPSLKWDDTYSDVTNSSPCCIATCPPPVINVNTSNGGGSGGGGGGFGPNDNIETTGEIICGSLKIANNNGVIVDIGEDTIGLGSIKLTGYLEVGDGTTSPPTNKNVGYCIPSFYDPTNSLNKELDTITYRTIDGYPYEIIKSYLIQPNQNGIIYGYLQGSLSPISFNIESDGTYNIQCNMSIQQSNSYSNDPPPTVEFILGYYNPDTFTFRLISSTPTRMTLTSYTSSSSAIQYNYSSGSSSGLLVSGRYTFPSAINGKIFAYLYQFVENVIPLTPPSITPNDGSGLSVNTIPSFIVTKLT
jgi:hypothetical protein